MGPRRIGNLITGWRLGHRAAAGGAVVLLLAGITVAAIGRVSPAQTPVGHTVRHRSRPVAAPTTAPTPPPVSAPPTTAAPPPPDPAIAAMAGRLVAAMGANPSCVLVRRGSTTLVDEGAGAALAPASTQKLVVGAAALATLGTDYRFVTRVVSDTPVVNGHAGHLWLVGSGDPLLATDAYLGLVLTHSHYPGPPVTPLDWLARALRQAGVTSSPGIAGDDSLLSDQRWLPTWPQQYLAEGDVGTLSALSLDEGWTSWLHPWVPVADPPAHAASALAGLMAAQGVSLGPVGPDSTAPVHAVTVATVTSAPLADIVSYMLATSDNHVAELLTRTVGRVAGASGTTSAGTAAVLRTAHRLGVPTSGAVMVDGSGLSPEDRATCSELLSAYQLSGRFPALRSGLPVAGRTGTLYDLWNTAPLAGHVVAKGGWIDGVAGLVGTVEIGRGLDFAFLVNGNFGYPGAVGMETAALDALASYATSHP
ncbi:MAG TPA: D-alanyl-D-alanine carboxypeptidase [Acidimicrobiales bacterium]|nr:D-alanyl-D-alanine carboxypeptidase [Acidimicrobiales bacterium]